jgi:DNA-binding NarL/FixJ family response regulator
LFTFGLPSTPDVAEGLPLRKAPGPGGSCIVGDRSMGWATRENIPGQVRPTGPAAERRASVPDGKSPPAVGDSHVRAAVAAERARIARQMDDTVSKSLLGLSMVAASLVSAPQEADLHALDQQLRELARLARRAVSDARCVINDLRGEALSGEVRSVATAWSILTGINVSLELAPESEVSADVRSEILAVLRAALRNVEQHARASRVRVWLRRVGEELLLAIADDGVGFCPPADLAELRADRRTGLIGMHERALRLGGKLTIESWPGGGSRLQVEMPAPVPASRQLRAVPATVQVQVIIADSNPMLRLGLRAALEHAPGLKIAAEADNGEDAVALVRRHHPEVLLLDIRMARAEGPETITQLSQLTQVVMLTCVDDAHLVMTAVAAGASGCIMREELEQGELIQVVIDAARQRPIPAWHGQADAAGSLRPKLGEAVSRPMGLRPRELEILGLIADGLSNRQIAARLGITEKTVKNHICSIYQRCGVCERSQAVRCWREFWSISGPPVGMSW